MENIFDVCVIGAGIGGLTAAVELKDRNIVVLEKLHRPGGTSFSFRRKEFEFLTGPLGFSHPDFVRAYFIEKGLGDLSFNRTSYQLVAGDINLIISNPLNRLEKDLSSAFPGENVKRAVNELRKVISDVRGIFNSEGKYYNALKGDWREDADISRYDIPAVDFFSQFVEDDALLSILTGMGLKESEFSLVASACMWDVLTETGVWYPSEGLGEAVKRLYSEVEDRVKLRHIVEKISTEGENFVISTSKGTFRAKNIVLNADVKKTHGLMDKELSESFRPFVERREESGSVLTVYAGIDKSEIDKERVKAHHVFYYPYLDENNNLRENRFFENEVEVTFLSDYGNFCPEGKAAIMIRSPANYDEFRFDTKEEYYRFKEKISEELLEVVEPLAPGITSADVKDSSTPVTYEVWGGRYRGSVAGWSWDDSVARCLVKTPVENFYICGIYSFSIPFLGAFPTSLYSGKLAARFVKMEKEGTKI